MSTLAVNSMLVRGWRFRSSKTKAYLDKVGLLDERRPLISRRTLERWVISGNDDNVSREQNVWIFAPLFSWALSSWFQMLSHKRPFASAMS